MITIKIPLHDQHNLHWINHDKSVFQINHKANTISCEIIAVVMEKNEDLDTWEESPFIEIWQYRIDKIHEIAMRYDSSEKMYAVKIDVPSSSFTLFPTLKEATSFMNVLKEYIFNTATSIVHLQ